MASKRLKALADLVPDASTVADIGSDHALLLRILAEQGKLKKGYAMDIAAGPLRAARANLEKTEYANISVIQSDGLRELPDDVTTVVIAGLGNRSIQRILDNDWSKVESLQNVIIQCNSEITLFRQYLATRQVNITAERWLTDYKDYQMIVFDCKKKTVYSEAEIFFGPKLLKEKPQDFLAYYRRRYDSLREIYLYSHDPGLLEELALIQTIL